MTAGAAQTCRRRPSGCVFLTFTQLGPATPIGWLCMGLVGSHGDTGPDTIHRLLRQQLCRN